MESAGGSNESGRSEGLSFPRIHQPSWKGSEASDDDGLPNLVAVGYKDTKFPDIVVKRRVELYDRKVTTYHDYEKNPKDNRTWYLDRNCVVKPAQSSDLRAKARFLRPSGTWTITAAIQGASNQVQLYEFTVDWPTSWAAAGYTTLTLGFDSLTEAQSWHSGIVGSIQRLKDAKRSKPGPSTSTIAEGTEVATPEASISRGQPAEAASPSEQAAEVEAEAAAAIEAEEERDTFPPAPADADEVVGVADDIAFVDPDSEAEEAAEEEEAGDDAFGDTPDGERWVPYRHTNGVAIYFHQTGEEGEEGKEQVGNGEFMVSCVVRGTPARCASALMRLRGNTTILGPAARAEVLKPCKDGDNKEVLRLVLTGTGYAGFFCAPREVIVERMLCREQGDDGATLIMFKSVDLDTSTADSAAGCIAAAASSGPSAFGKGLFKKPVRCRVQGGYTIAGLRGQGAASQESLVTCIVKVDLGGVCSVRSWLHPVADVAGWTDSFLDRILMTVVLLRDEVEQRRFMQRPFGIVGGTKAKMDEDGQLVDGPTSAAAEHAVPDSSATSAVGSILSKTPSLAVRSIISAAPPAPAARMMSMSVARSKMPGQHAMIKEVLERAAEEPSEPLDLERIRSLATMPRAMWAEIHMPGTDAPFMVRGPTYLRDRKKIPAGQPQFLLGAVDLIILPPAGTVSGQAPAPAGVPARSAPVDHIARFLPSVREGGAAFSVVFNLIIPGTPMLALVMVFVCDKHPRILGTPPQDPMEEKHDWQPFDFVLHKFVYSSNDVRNKMLKLIPHIAEGSWMIKQSVGTTPVIIGKQLKTTYHLTDRYLEVDIDVSANSTANYVTGMVRGATKSLVIDLGLVLEGQAPWELPECLLGCLRLPHLDCAKAMVPVDWTKELPLK